MNKHTPGPWIVMPRFPHHVIPASHEKLSLGGSVDRTEDEQRFAWPIATVCADGLPRWTREQIAGNARLIAAAPELLAAAFLTVCALMDEHGVRPGDSDDLVYDLLGSAVSGAYLDLRAAIAKATGGSHA